MLPSSNCFVGPAKLRQHIAQQMMERHVFGMCGSCRFQYGCRLLGPIKFAQPLAKPKSRRAVLWITGHPGLQRGHQLILHHHRHLLDYRHICQGCGVDPVDTHTSVLIHQIEHRSMHGVELGNAGLVVHRTLHRPDVHIGDVILGQQPRRGRLVCRVEQLLHVPLALVHAARLALLILVQPP